MQEKKVAYSLVWIKAQLVKVTGVAEAINCEADGALAQAKTLAGALALVKIAISS